jgi:acyl carrier protein
MTNNSRLRDFIRENFLFGQTNSTLTDDTSLVESGIIDSTGVLEIIGFLERDLGVKVHDDEIIPQNLDSIRNLTEYVERKLNNTPRELAVCR